MERQLFLRLEKLLPERIPVECAFFEVNDVPVVIWPNGQCEAYDTATPRAYNLDVAKLFGTKVTEATFRVIVYQHYYKRHGLPTEFPAESKFYNVAGEPVWLGPDGTCESFAQRWPHPFPAEKTRKEGKEIPQAVFKGLVFEKDTPRVSQPVANQNAKKSPSGKRAA